MCAGRLCTRSMYVCTGGCAWKHSRHTCVPDSKYVHAHVHTCDQSWGPFGTVPGQCLLLPEGVSTWFKQLSIAYMHSPAHMCPSSCVPAACPWTRTQCPTPGQPSPWPLPWYSAHPQEPRPAGGLHPRPQTSWAPRALGQLSKAGISEAGPTPPLPH